jgi:hypothetical protein
MSLRSVLGVALIYASGNIPFLLMGRVSWGYALGLCAVPTKTYALLDQVFLISALTRSSGRRREGGMASNPFRNQSFRVDPRKVRLPATYFWYTTLYLNCVGNDLSVIKISSPSSTRSHSFFSRLGRVCSSRPAICMYSDFSPVRIEGFLSCLLIVSAFI